MGRLFSRHRRVLWIMPLLAVLCGLAFHLWVRRIDCAFAVLPSPSDPAWVIEPGACMATRAPVENSPRYRLLQSAEVLGAAAEDAGLLQLWHVDREQAGKRLREVMSLNAVPDRVEVEVRLASIPGADAVAVCRAILERVLAEEAARETRKAEEKMAAVQARIEGAKADRALAKERSSWFSEKVDGGSAEFRLAASVSRSEYLAKELEVEDWTKLGEVMKKELEGARGVGGSYEGPGWRRASAVERLRSSGAVVLGALGVGVVVGLVVALMAGRGVSEA